jgi:PatG Domain
MEQPETNDKTPTESTGLREVVVEPSAKPENVAIDTPATSVGRLLPAQAPACPTCGTAQVGTLATSSYVYAVGCIKGIFPNASVERQAAQVTGRAETAGKTDKQAFYDILSRRENRYLARHLCWVLTVQGLETYILQPRDPADLDLLISAIEPHESPRLSTVVGVRGPVAPPEFCNGLMIPIVIFDQIYTFSREALIKAIPRPEGVPAERFEATAREVLDRFLQVNENAGASDEHRVLNWLSVSYPVIYADAAEKFARDFSLTAIETRPSLLSGAYKIYDVIISYEGRKNGVTEKFFVSVDATGPWPYLARKYSPYVDR